LEWGKCVGRVRRILKQDVRNEMAKQRKALLTQRLPKGFDGKKWSYEINQFEVIVLAVVGKVAMVKRSKCYPIIVDTKDLEGLVDD